MLQHSFEICDHRPICLPSISPCFAPSIMIQIPRQGGCWVFLSLFITQPLVLIPFAHLSNPGFSIPMKCSLFETENLTSTNGCIFSRALCHKMIPLSLFLETGSGVAEVGRSAPLKASANLRKHKAGFFRVLFSTALYLVTVQVPFGCACNLESFTLVSGRRGSWAGDQSHQQHVISALLWGVWPQQRHTAKFPSEAGWAGKALKKQMLCFLMENITSLGCGWIVSSLWLVSLWIQAC